MHRRERAEYSNMDTRTQRLSSALQAALAALEFAQVPAVVTTRECRGRYHALACKWHPDKQAPGSSAAHMARCHEQMAKINDAYESLLDAIRPHEANEPAGHVPDDPGPQRGRGSSEGGHFRLRAGRWAGTYSGVLNGLMSPSSLKEFIFSRIQAMVRDGQPVSVLEFACGREIHKEPAAETHKEHFHYIIKVSHQMDCWSDVFDAETSCGSVRCHITTMSASSTDPNRHYINWIGYVKKEGDYIAYFPNGEPVPAKRTLDSESAGGATSDKDVWQFFGECVANATTPAEAVEPMAKFDMKTYVMCHQQMMGAAVRA